MESSVLGLLCTSLLAAQPQLTAIGIVTDIRGSAHSFHAAASGDFTLVIGDSVYLNDRIATDAAGRVQIQLLDDTLFTVGPNSGLVLDRFIYNPSSGVGEILIDVFQGAFRFLSGKVAKSGPLNMKVRLPICMIGIHGTEVAGEVDNKVSIYHLGGSRIEVSNQFGAQMVNPGSWVTVEPKQPPSLPVRIPPDKQDSIADALPLNLAKLDLAKFTGEVPQITEQQVRDLYTKLTNAFKNSDLAGVLDNFSSTWNVGSGESKKDAEENLRRQTFGKYYNIDYHTELISVQPSLEKKGCWEVKRTETMSGKPIWTGRSSRIEETSTVSDTVCADPKSHEPKVFRSDNGILVY